MRTFAIVLALCCVGCSSSYSVDGTWERGGVPGDRYGYRVLQLQRVGDDIVGLACHVSSGFLMYRDRPVTGTYPRTSFDASLDASDRVRLNLTIVGEGLIVGTDPGSATWEFGRTASDRYDARAETPPR